MLEWCMAHLWMTLSLVPIFLIVIESAISNICKTIAFYCGVYYDAKDVKVIGNKFDNPTLLEGDN